MKISKQSIKKEKINKELEKDKTFDKRWDAKFGSPRTEVLPTSAALKLLHEMVIFS